MRGLLVKDLRLMMGQKKFLLLLLFMTVVLNFNDNITFVVYYLTFVCSFFVISSIAYDENDNGYPFLFCLPIDRSVYVREKYVFEVLLNIVSWLAGFFICFLFQDLYLFYIKNILGLCVCVCFHRVYNRWGKIIIRMRYE